MLLDIEAADLDKVIYFAGYIITKVVESEKGGRLQKFGFEYKAKLKEVQSKEEKDALKSSMLKAKGELDALVLYRVLSEIDYYGLSMKYGEIFEAETGAESIYNIFKNINLDEFKNKTELLAETATAQDRPKIIARINLAKSMKRGHSSGVDVLDRPPRHSAGAPAHGGFRRRKARHFRFERFVPKSHKQKQPLERDWWR